MQARKVHLNDETNISGEHEIFRMKSIIILIQNTAEWHGRAVELHSPEWWRRLGYLMFAQRMRPIFLLWDTR